MPRQDLPVNPNSVVVRFPTSYKVEAEATITSLELADRLGQKHFTVLKRIRKYNEDRSSSNRCIIGNYAATYTDSQGKTRPMYRITQVGIIRLALTLGIAEEVVESLLQTVNKLAEENVQLILKQMEALEDAANPDALVLLETKYGRKISKHVPKEYKKIPARVVNQFTGEITVQRVDPALLSPTELSEAMLDQHLAIAEGVAAKTKNYTAFHDAVARWRPSSGKKQPVPEDFGLRTQYSPFFT